ncbi:hypothetical protein [Variovorax guangxiensis]|nr:hypothetical protein [Variovorax guangxiensis]
MRKKFSIGLYAVGLALVLAGCGGGGGSPSVPSTAGGGSGSSGGGSGTPETPTPPVATPSLTLAIYGADGAVSKNIGLGGSFVARASLRDASGTAVAGRTVSFTLPDTSFASLSPTTALTSSAGVAEVAIVPASLTAAGATTLTATATLGTATVTGTTDFSITSPNLSLSALTASSTSLVSGGSTTLTVNALIAGSPLTAQPANIAFTATCGRINGIDTGTTVSTNGSGIATATYSAVNGAGNLCSGPVTIAATTAGATSVNTSVTVAAPTATAVTFVGASLPQIYVAGAGNPEQSLLTYKVLSSVNTPLSNQTVNFTLVQTPIGVTLSQLTGTTDSDGLVAVTVSSGTVPGPLKVRAALASSSTVFAESQNLTVASGPPSQKFMSLSVSKFSLEGAVRDGTATTLTVRVADRQGNAVVDGTVVNFTAEGGQVGSSCATATVGQISSCSVNFQTQNPRPVNGRVSVLAYLEGTKDYVDNNGNNRYDPGTDTLIQLGDAYRDDDEDRLYDSSKDAFVFARAVQGACPSQTNGAFPSRGGTCDTAALSTTVRQQAVLLFAATSPQLEVVQQTASVFEFKLGSSGVGLALLPMPAGTLVAVTPIDNSPGNNISCSVNDFSGSTVADVAPQPGSPLEDLRTLHLASLKDCAAGDSVKVSVTVPSGLVTEKLFNLP